MHASKVVAAYVGIKAKDLATKHAQPGMVTWRLINRQLVNKIISTLHEVYYVGLAKEVLETRRELATLVRFLFDERLRHDGFLHFIKGNSV
jgi:hypothetical protein